MSVRIWTADEVLALGVLTDVPTAGEIVAGLSRSQSYQAVKLGTFPVGVIRCGRSMTVPVAPILDLLGIKRPNAVKCAVYDRSGELVGVVDPDRITPVVEQSSPLGDALAMWAEDLWIQDSRPAKNDDGMSETG